MKLTTILISASCLTASAFGVTPISKTIASSSSSVIKPIRKTHPAAPSLALRDAALTRGGAVPGWAAYNDALDKYPLTAKACTSLVGWLLGDLLAQVRLFHIQYPSLINMYRFNNIFFTQLFIVKSATLDIRRLVVLSAFGFLYHGPSGHYFYNWLDSKIPGTDGKTVATKVLIDQLFWCPIFMTVFFTYLGLVNGDSLTTIGSKIRNDLLKACQGSWKVCLLTKCMTF